MTSQSGRKIIAIHILPNISRSNGNQTMKFDQLIEDNMRKIFVEKSYTKWAAEIIPRPLMVNFEHASGSIVKNSKQFVLLYDNLRAIEI